uniref:Kindlin-2 N-terminal domain-containing protein n=1 Tax=Phlebotomus papatasi TaxID=29031 RepID=A0A1B0DPK9_PHLPP
MIHVGDNTWNLRVFITDLQVEKTLRVRGDLHIGGVMLKLVDPGCLFLFWFFLHSDLPSRKGTKIYSDEPRE